MNCSDSEASLLDFPCFGQEGYQLEPEYTEDELRQQEEEHAIRQQEILNNPRKNTKDWCRCFNCIPMPLPSECLCCHEFTLLEEKIDVGECITNNTDFRTVCLNPVVLETSYISFLRYKRHRGRAPDALNNRQSRLMAYRQYVCWVRKGQPLGRKHRVILPACVVAAIRKEFPSPDNQYEGSRNVKVMFQTLISLYDLQKL